MSNLNPYHAVGQSLRALADVVEALGAPTEHAPEWYDHRTYPHGPEAFRRHIRAGMKAVRAGKAYKVRRSDAEAFWTTLAPRARKAKTLKPQDLSTAELLRMSGLRVIGGSR